MKNLLILLLLGFTSLSFSQTTRNQMNSLTMYSVHGEHDSVIYYSSQYMQRDSLNQGLWRRRAQSKFQLNDTIGAINDYNKCISLDSTNLEPMLQLANLYLSIEDNKQALEICEYIKNISLDSTNPKSMLQLANLYRSIGDIKQALEICEYVIENNDQYRLSALDLKGSTYIAENQIESAVECSLEIVKVKPNAHYLYTLALLYSSIEDFEKTLDYLKAVKVAKDFKKELYPDLESYITECETKLHH